MFPKVTQENNFLIEFDEDKVIHQMVNDIMNIIFELPTTIKKN